MEKMENKNEKKEYMKIRKNFGKQPLFCSVGPHLIDSIAPDKLEQLCYGLRNPVNQETQASSSQKICDVNTPVITITGNGVNHAEGGWPKEIAFTDEEATTRHIRRLERDEGYIAAIQNSYKDFNHYIKQNNAIEMYQMYYSQMPSIKPIEKHSIQMGYVFKDSTKRPIASLSWTYEDDSKIVAAYCDKRYPINYPRNKDLLCAVWSLDKSTSPIHTFLPPTACWQAICSPGNATVIIGGLEDGRVCLFDIRVKKEPVLTSPVYLAHRYPVSALVYLVSRLNLEFYSGSTDGLVMCWDIRNLSNPTDSLIMNLSGASSEKDSLANSEGVSTLQFDKSFPTKFMCGTDTGLVVSVNRKGKSHSDIMQAVYRAHAGPVKALHCSPCTSKMFITCGDWSVDIWSEDILTSPIVTGIRHRHQINDVAWCPSRLSSYMSVCADGKLRYWDLLRKYDTPILSIMISKVPLLKIKPHDQGHLVAIGDKRGNIFTLQLSETLVNSGDKDKIFIMQAYEREHRREYILEAKVKEIRLKLAEAHLAETTVAEKTISEEAALKEAEDEYKRIVNAETRNFTLASDQHRREQKLR